MLAACYDMDLASKYYSLHSELTLGCSASQTTTSVQLFVQYSGQLTMLTEHCQEDVTDIIESNTSKIGLCALSKICGTGQQEASMARASVALLEGVCWHAELLCTGCVHTSQSAGPNSTLHASLCHTATIQSY